ncbi:protein LAZY 1-like [Vicia villosa]|uniref:protein LAZY 1-like n=1 Tax=Vicia villosa TaxID=3911 RepID=UPI00273AE0A5|nr:protein LAZY 1-like [Vicia villosa]
MKLFQWVHRKLRQNIDPVKDFTLGNPCAPRLTVQLTVDSQYSQTKSSFSSINHSCFLKPRYQESQTSWGREEETSAAISELFEGFLTIGTLGAEAVTNEPATPTFATPLENLPKKDVMETELKLISYELEKFLEAEEECFNESSRKNSLSNITLSRKETDGSDAEEYGNEAVCPLQGYLLGSSFKIIEKVEVTEEWASLAELFQRTKTTKEECTETGVKEKQVKQAQKSAMHIMKNMWKKVYSSSKSCSTAGNIVDSTTTNAKLRKVPRKFHRKVYPKDTINAKSVTKSHKDDNEGTRNPDPGRKFNTDNKSKKWSKHCETIWNPSQDGLSCDGSTGNNEHWIKTDAEYLVLEL